MFNLDFTDIAILAAVTLAIVNAIKNATKNKLGYWYMLISAGVGAALYAIGLYAPDVAIGFIVVGLVASGIYDTYTKT